MFPAIDDVFETLTLVLESEKERVEEENRAEEARLAEEHIIEQCRARQSYLEDIYNLLLAEPDDQKAAGLFPLPPWDEFAELESAKLLYYPDDSTFDETSTMEYSYPCIASEIDKLRASLKSELVAKFAEALSTATSNALVTKNPSDYPDLPYSTVSDNTFTEVQVGDVLALATTTFQCNKNSQYGSKGCGAVGSCSILFSHECARADDKPVYSLKAASYGVEASELKLVLKLIEVSGLDPGTATTEDMEAFGRGFSCISCKSPSLTSVSRTWIQMVSGASFSPRSALATLTLIRPPQIRHLVARHYYRYARELLDFDIVCEAEDKAISRLLE